MFIAVLIAFVIFLNFAFVMSLFWWTLSFLVISGPTFKLVCPCSHLPGLHLCFVSLCMYVWCCPPPTHSLLVCSFAVLVHVAYVLQLSLSLCFASISPAFATSRINVLDAMFLDLYSCYGSVALLFCLCVQLKSVCFIFSISASMSSMERSSYKTSCSFMSCVGSIAGGVVQPCWNPKGLFTAGTVHQSSVQFSLDILLFILYIVATSTPYF